MPRKVKNIKTEEISETTETPPKEKEEELKIEDVLKNIKESKEELIQKRKEINTLLSTIRMSEKHLYSLIH